MKHFSLLEFTNSATALKQGLDNTPTAEHRRNLEELVGSMLDPLREAWAVQCAHELWGTPALRVSSGYRGFRLNAAVGGSETSAHCCGWAADLVPQNGRLSEFRDFCIAWLRGKAYDQFISEDERAGVPQWLHIGLKNRQGGQRRQLLVMRGGKYSTLKA